MTATRRILHLDMDAFFAAIELRRRPELRGQPVIVGGRGDPRARGVVSTATYEAREHGVRSGMPLRSAWRLCPQAVFLPVDFETYAAESARIKAMLREFSPILEDAGIDEAYLDISDVPGESGDIARTIKRRIREETGLSCSIGIAPNKLLAKIASDLEKPDGLTILAESDVPGRVWPLPARKLQGVGPKTEKRLAALGIGTIGELAAAPLARLAEHFGEAHGRYLHEAAQGRDDSPLVTHWEPQSMSREMTFERDTADWSLITHMLLVLTRELAESLRAEGYRGRNVTVKLRYADFETHTHAETLPAPTDDLGTIREATGRCLARFARGRRVRLIGVRVGGLVREGDGER
jgi:DNA polymerase-4